MVIIERLQQFKKNTKIEPVNFNMPRVPSATPMPGKPKGKGQSI